MVISRLKLDNNGCLSLGYLQVKMIDLGLPCAFSINPICTSPPKYAWSYSKPFSLWTCCIYVNCSIFWNTNFIFPLWAMLAYICIEYGQVKYKLDKKIDKLEFVLWYVIKLIE